MTPYKPADLPELEARLFELAKVLDSAARPMEPWRIMVLALGRRARALYHGLILAAQVSPEAVALTVARSMVELMILIPWLALKPELYPDMWGAESDRLDVAMINQMRSKTILLAGRAQPDVRRAKQREVAAMRALGKENGLRWIKDTGSLMPPLEQMAEEVNDVMVWEAYAALYRHTSKWAHSEAGSFAKTVTIGDDGLPLLRSEESDFDRAALRSLGVSMFSILLTATSRIVGLGIEKESDVIRAYVTGRILVDPGNWPPPPTRAERRRIGKERQSRRSGT